MKSIAENALKEALKYTDNAEILIEEDKSMKVEVQNDKIDFAKNEVNLGLGVRVIIDNKMGFAQTSDLNKIKETVQRAVENSKANIVDKHFKLAEPNKYPIIKGVYDSKFESFSVDDAIDFSQRLLDTSIDAGCEPTSGGFSTGKSTSLILNSRGVECGNITTGFGGFIAVNAERDGEKSTAYDSASSCFMRDFNPEKLATDVCNLAKDSINGKSIETSDMDVVLDYHAGIGLLGTFITGFSADNVQRGRSMLADKLGEKMLNSNLSVYDDGTFEGGMNSSKCDGEGTPTQRTCLVDNGIINSFIYDLYTASKGNSVSTGNAGRSYASTPSISTSNIIVDFDDYTNLEDVKTGIWVTDVLGAHTANPISGDFSVEVNNAFIIENGELVNPVKKGMLSGNIFELLSDVEALSDSVKQRGSIVLPQLLAHNLRVIGD
jgi:PmbA protein